MKTILSLCSAWLLGTTAYQSGPHLLARHRAEVAREHGFFVTVPLDYHDPNAGTLRLYARTVTPFDPARPSLIYFEGGPGYHCHFDPVGLRAAAVGYNLVLFDARGVALSRPLTAARHRSESFYSSEFTALDAEHIRRALGIERWSVAGSSFGTLAATIYASWFPQRTRSLTLIAALFGLDSLGASPQRICDHHARSGVFEPVRAMMRAAGLGSNDLLWKDGEARTLDGWIEQTLYESGAFGLPALARALMRPDATRGSHARGRPAAEEPDPVVLRVQTVSDQSKVAVDYPVTVPTTYIHGTADARTPPRQAVLHFKRTARGFRQMILLRGVGHRAFASPASFAVPDALVALPATVLADVWAGRAIQSDSECDQWLRVSSARLITRSVGSD